MCNESLSHEARPLHGVSLSSCRRHPGPWCFRTVSINPTPCSASHADFQNLAAPKRGSALAAVWNTIRLEHITSGWLPWMATDPNSHRTFLSATACTMIYSGASDTVERPMTSNCHTITNQLLPVPCLSLSFLSLPVPCLSLGSPQTVNLFAVASVGSLAAQQTGDLLETPNTSQCI